MSNNFKEMKISRCKLNTLLISTLNLTSRGS